MGAELLDEILGCPNLPSLPAVALQVIDLTKDPDVSMKELAETIQNDQGLTTKVLRTVNSSFFGLRQRCSTINQALVLLGLGAVKSLTLGFSLVQSLKSEQEDAFDHVAYWRRGLVTAVSAKSFARANGHARQDEAFLGGLLQDVGMMAMYRALPERYLAILARSQRDHRQLVKEELAELELQHPDVGAMLCQRWRLPDELVVPVKYHERPTAAPRDHSEIVRFVALGNIAHDVFTDPAPSESLDRLYARSEQWFGMTGTQVDDRVHEIAAAVKEMSSLFRLNTGPYRDPEDILRYADERLHERAREEALRQKPASPDSRIIARSDDRDPVTGLVSSIGFAESARRAFDTAKATGEPMAFIQIRVDQLDSLRSTQGTAAADQLTLRAATLLRKNLEPLGGIISRNGDDVFSAVLPGATRVAASKAAAEFSADLARSSANCFPSTGPQVPLTASVGISAIDKETALAFARLQQLMGAAARSLEAARGSGGGCVRVFVPKKLAA